MRSIEQIKALAANYFEEVRSIRRQLHSRPELSFQEYKTAAFVEDLLRTAGIEVSRMGETGLVALIGNPDASKTIALRADLDALPIHEKTNVPYRSENEGVMHACGHDVHTSSLIGAALILHQLKDSLPGSIKLIFQPGEEKLPGGASLMIRDGVLKDPGPFAILGQHVTNELPAGRAGFRPGLYMASADEIYVHVKGKGGHAAMPDQNIDPILIASHLIIALQQVVSRWCKPALPCVLSFGKIIGSGATNVIPDEVYLEGTFRTFDENWRHEAHRRMKQLAKNLGESMGGSIEFDIAVGYPSLKNDEALTHQAIRHAKTYLGDEKVYALDIRPTAEDFAFYSQEIPACFYRLGTGNPEKGINAPIHSPLFDIDEDALLTGMGLMAYLAVKSFD